MIIVYSGGYNKFVMTEKGFAFDKQIEFGTINRILLVYLLGTCCILIAYLSHANRILIA